MRGVVYNVLVGLSVFIFTGCASELETSSLDYAELISTFDFKSSDQLWEGGVSDYPAEYEDSVYFHVANEQLSNSASVYDGRAQSISAKNPHGDLFYYFKKQISGFKKNTHYELDFEFLVFSQLTENNSIASGEDVFLKVGAVNFEPDLKKELRQLSDYITLNVDKGDVNGSSGNDMVNLGSIKDFMGPQPESISGNTFDIPMEVKSDDDGAIWLIIGVDSGIKSDLTFSLAAITVYYSEILG